MTKLIAGYIEPICPHCDVEVLKWHARKINDIPLLIQCSHCNGWFNIKQRKIYIAEQVFDFVPK